jgi:3-hydroxyisobutyrate dehydrogenase-like beta-hydroxyacid dehydrogenase
MTVTRNMTIGLLHPGRMGAAIGAQLRTAGASVVWCPEGRSQDTSNRAVASDLQAVETLDDLLKLSDIVLCVCPPAAAEDVAEQVAVRRFRGLYVEANAISPQRATRIAARLTDGGARVIDACIFGPPPSSESTVRFYLSGPDPELRSVAALFTGTQVTAFPMNGEIGKASALKLTLSAYQKVSRALAAVAYALADHHGLRDEVLTESQHFSRSAINDPGYLPSVAARAWRWEPEMAEVAEMLGAAGLPEEFSHAAASVFRHWCDDKDDFEIDLETLLRQLRA